MLNDKKLILLCQKDNKKALDKLYKKYSSTIYGVCLLYFNNIDDAQDVFQDSFIKIINNIKNYQFKGSFEGWMRQITVNTALNYLKARKNLVNNHIDFSNIEIDGEVPDSLSKMTEKELLDLIHELPEMCKAIFILYVIEGYKHEDIAKQFNINEATSRSHLTRARKILIDLLKEKRHERF